MMTMDDNPNYDLMVMRAREMLLDGSGVSIDRLPLLRVIFERAATQCSESLRQLFSSVALFTIDGIVTERIADVLDSCDSNDVFGIIHVQAWDSRFLIAIEQGTVLLLAEALFGGDGTEAPVGDKRPLSNIELQLAKRAFELFAQALQSAFATVCETAFRLDRVETRLDFVTIAPRTAFAIKTRLKVQMLGREGHIFTLIPQSALNSIRQELERDIAAEGPAGDPQWLKQIRNEVGLSVVAVQGLIEEFHFTLADIANLRVGQVMRLEATTKTPVKLVCNSEHLFWCDLGRADGFHTLKISESVSREQELINEILGN
ncbi:MAG TPA: flagellar motor switch protein FliM [Methylocella sp.]|nr:flagellar motor switch protein FliM [Methylocella sp.]